MTGCVIEKVAIAGDHVLPDSALTDKIATAKTDRVIGGAFEHLPILSIWDRLTVEYETLDPFVLERDLGRIERVYRLRGYYDAHARAARVIRVNKERIRVEIAVTEGDPVLIGAVTPVYEGATQPTDATKALVKHLLRHEKPGAPFDEDTFEADKKALRRALTDVGYAYSQAHAHADVDLAKHEATLTYTIDLGPLCTFGDVTIEGYGDLPLDKLRQAVHIINGQPYSTDRIEGAQNALSDLRVLGSVTGTPELSPGEPRSTVIPVTFHVTPTTLKTIKSGVGAEVGSRVEWHGVANWENRNFLGGLRHFTIEAKPGFVVNPLTFATLFSKPTTPVDILFELRVHAELEQPGFIEARTKGLISIAASLYQLQPLDTLGYLELAGKTGVSRDFWSRRVSTALSLNMAFDQPIQMLNYTPIDAAHGYHRIIVPFVQATGVLDLRNGFDGKRDTINPHSGFYLSNDTQFAWVDSQDLRFRPEMRGYVPIGRKVTLALRATGGILYAYGGDLAQTPDPGCPFGPDPGARCVKPRGSVPRAQYIQLLQLRGFGSGGPTSNRGYAYNGVGPQEFIPNISTVGSNGQLVPIATSGAALWEGSAELRFPLYEKLGATVFVDGSDVRWSLAELAAPFAPHLSSGLGLRYLTPVGPFRADFGVRIPGAQVIGQGATGKCPVFDPSGASGGTAAQCYLSPRFGQASPVLSLPLAVSLAIGEAF
jgi:outer membrane protein insertion porin family/translocation and assembly module TamA